MLPDCPICDIVSTSRVKRERRKRCAPGGTAGGCVGVVCRKVTCSNPRREKSRNAPGSPRHPVSLLRQQEELFKAVVRENISGKVRISGTLNVTAFDGSTAEMLRHCMRALVGARGLTQDFWHYQVDDERSQQFPELRRLLPGEVIRPGQQLIARCCSAGRPGRVPRPEPSQYGVYTVIATAAVSGNLEAFSRHPSAPLPRL